MSEDREFLFSGRDHAIGAHTDMPRGEVFIVSDEAAGVRCRLSGGLKVQAVRDLVGDEAFRLESITPLAQRS